jgi:hypothetical protein
MSLEWKRSYWFHSVVQVVALQCQNAVGSSPLSLDESETVENPAAGSCPCISGAWRYTMFPAVSRSQAWIIQRDA